MSSRLAVLIVVLISTLAAGCARPAAQQAPPADPQVTVAAVVARDVTEWDEFTGRLEAVNTVAIRPRVSGYVSAVRAHNAGTPEDGAMQRSRYYNYTPQEFGRLRYAIEQIAKEAAGKRVLVVTIPRPDDFAAAQSGKPAPLPAELTNVAQGAGIDYLDLLPTMQRGGLAPRRRAEERWWSWRWWRPYGLEGPRPV